jgi:hypothetical protein
VLESSEVIGDDVAPLIAHGVPGLRPTQDLRFYFHYHHTAADTLDKVDPHHLAGNAATVAVTAYALADAAEAAPHGK